MAKKNSMQIEHKLKNVINTYLNNILLRYLVTELTTIFSLCKM